MRRRFNKEPAARPFNETSSLLALSLNSPGTIRSRSRDLLHRLCQLSVVFRFERDIGHRDNAAQPAVHIADGDAADLMLAHLADGFVYRIIRRAGDHVI